MKLFQALVLAPLKGAMFCMFLPFIGFAMLFYALALAAKNCLTTRKKIL